MGIAMRVYHVQGTTRAATNTAHRVPMVVINDHTVSRCNFVRARTNTSAFAEGVLVGMGPSVAKTVLAMS